jgi:hypothetical protein
MVSEDPSFVMTFTTPPPVVQFDNVGSWQGPMPYTYFDLVLDLV